MLPNFDDTIDTAANRDWQPPSNVKVFHSFLGFGGYYRWFVKDFSSLAQPLNPLLEGNSTHTVSKRKKFKRKSSKPAKWIWDHGQQEASSLYSETSWLVGLSSSLSLSFFYCIFCFRKIISPEFICRLHPPNNPAH